ncbi:hypothetical protein COO60DRAFT_405223 [Scenedesmus sp. NREL 46B-D3]|nr:hypothetical protein COO60DRAFT_405223 [Scenedesmus sp. NREL 46B-D3]
MLSESGETTVKYLARVARSDTPQPVYAVTGFITVTNPSSTQPVIVPAILAVLGDGAESAGSSSSSSSSNTALTVAVHATCSQPYPLTLAAKASVHCSFDIEVPSQQAGQVSAVVMTGTGERCYVQQGMPYTFAAKSTAPEQLKQQQQPTGTGGAADDCAVLSIRFPRRDITVSSIVPDQNWQLRWEAAAAAWQGRRMPVCWQEETVQARQFGFTAIFQAQAGFLNCIEHQVPVFAMVTPTNRTQPTSRSQALFNITASSSCPPASTAGQQQQQPTWLQ